MAKKKLAKGIQVGSNFVGDRSQTRKNVQGTMHSEKQYSVVAGCPKRTKKRKRRDLQKALVSGGAPPLSVNDSNDEKSCLDMHLVPEASKAPAKLVMKKRKARKKLVADEVASRCEPKRPKLDENRVNAVTELPVEEFRKKHEIIVASSCPDPFQTFDAAEAQFTPIFTKALRDQGFELPTPIQAQAWPIAMRGDDMVAVAKTGSGKTCAFILPALVRLAAWSNAENEMKRANMACPRVLVLAPTRELVQQIAEETEKFASVNRNRVVCLFGGVQKTNRFTNCDWVPMW